MPQIELLKEPAHDCLNNCFIMFEGLADEIIQKIFFRFPELMPVISDIILGVLEKVKFTKMHVNYLRLREKH